VSAEPTEDFYSTFWTLQRFFTNPPLLFSTSTISGTSSPPNDYSTLRRSLSKTLEAFAEATKKEKELLGSTASTATAGAGAGAGKGKEDRKDVGLDGGSEKEVIEHYFFPKFLTSRSLLDLEVRRLSLLRQAVLTRGG